MKILGCHLLAELADCHPAKLESLSYLEKTLKEAARVAGATVVNSVFHRYNPQGLSGIVVIAESHLSIHTWPEYRYAAVDCFTCGTSVDPRRALEHIRVALGCENMQVREVNRGMPSDFEEIIAHKPADFKPSVTK